MTLERRLSGDSDFKNEGGMRTSTDERSFYKMVNATTAEGQGQSNMRKLVGHALEQKSNGKEDGSHVKNSTAKSKMQRKWVKKLKEFKLGRRLVVC